MNCQRIPHGEGAGWKIVGVCLIVNLLAVAIAVSCGLLFGLVAAITKSPFLTSLAIGIEPIGTAFVDLLKMVVIPLVASVIFVGVGAMGGGLARNLIRAGKQVLVFDLNPEAVKQTLEAGSTGKAAAELQELAAADVVFTSLPLPQHLEETMLGENGLLKAMKPGAAYIDVSTIDPQTARKLSDAADAQGVKFLECPLGKTPAQAETAEEPIFAGGDQNHGSKGQGNTGSTGQGQTTQNRGG